MATETRYWLCSGLLSGGAQRTMAHPCAYGRHDLSCIPTLEDYAVLWNVAHDRFLDSHISPYVDAVARRAVACTEWDEDIDEDVYDALWGKALFRPLRPMRARQPAADQAEECDCGCVPEGRRNLCAE
jgi:hypothetical protein